MIGISVEDMRRLAAHRIHVHLYSASYYRQKNTGNNLYGRVAQGYFHVHAYCPNEKWVEEFSRYDAGCYMPATAGTGEICSVPCGMI